MKKKRLLPYLLCSLGLVAGIALKGVQPFSIVENRELTTQPILDFGHCLNKSSQESIEKFLNDQILFGEKMKRLYHEVENRVNQGLLSWFSHHRYYTDLGHYLNHYGDSDMIVYKREDNVDLSGMNRFIECWNQVLKELNIPTTLYYVTTSSVLNFNQPYLEDVYYETLKGLMVDRRGRLEISDFEEYQQLFFKTDQHWNYRGSYQGYRDICTLSGITPIETQATINHHLQTFGSSARILSNFQAPEDFITYQFEEIPFLITLINGKLASYGHEQDYYQGNIEDIFAMNHYAYYYGDDVGEVHFINPAQEGHLCVIGTSYDNAIIKLLAHSFRDVYAVDLCCYQEDMGEVFDLKDYVKKHKIDQLLFVGDQYLFMEGE